MAASSTKASQKKIEHCVFKWSIQNISLCSRKPESRISSPSFRLDPCSTTSWHLFFFPLGPNKTGGGMAVHLARDSDDGGPGSVSVHFRLQIPTTSEKILEWADYQIFKRGIEYGFDDILKVENFVDQASEEDTLLITCYIYVFNSTLESASISDSHLLSLSTDMKNSRTRSDLNDVVLKLSDGEIAGNKLVLSARSPYFKKALEGETGDHTVISLPKSNIAAMEEVLNFIYAGDFDVPLLNQPSPYVLFEHAERFGIIDMKAVLQPNEIEAHTSIEVDVCEFSWRIEDFTLSEDDKCTSYIESPPFGSCFGKKMWVLKLYKRNKIFSNNIAIFVEACFQTSDCILALEISLLDEEGESQHSSKLLQRISSYERCGFSNFMPRVFLSKASPKIWVDNTITVQCKMKVSYGNTSCKVTRNRISTGGRSISHANLSKDFWKLYESGYLSDFTLKVAEKEFKVHRFVLSARSSIFAKHIKDKTLEVLKLELVDGDALDVFLRYIYSGTIDTKVHNLEMLLKLFELSKKFQVDALREKCSEVIGSKFNVKEICDVLVQADLQKNRVVRKAALVYICCNVSKIFVSEDWQNLLKTNRDLGEEILRWLELSFQTRGCK